MRWRACWQINGLRISEALGADIEHLGVMRGHRTLTVARKLVSYSVSFLSLGS